MKTDTAYDIIENYVKDISNSYHIKVYSDMTACVSLYINGKALTLESELSLVYTLLKELNNKYSESSNTEQTQESKRIRYV